MNRGVGSGSCGGERKMPSIDVVVESKASSQSASKIDRRTVTREFLYAFFNRLGRRMRTLTPRKTLAKASQKCYRLPLPVTKHRYKKFVFGAGRLIYVFIFKHFQCSKWIGRLADANLRTGFVTMLGVFPAKSVTKMITGTMLTLPGGATLRVALHVAT